MDVVAYADALTSLRARQIAYRPVRLIPARALAVGLRENSPPAWRPLAQGLGRTAAPQSGPAPPPHETRSFAVLGREIPANGSDLWNATPAGLLGAFTLHGFDHLADYACGPSSPAGDAFWVGLLDRWLAESGQPSGPAWHPFPLSRRIVAWSAALSPGEWLETVASRMLASLDLQVRFLRRRVEHDIGGNHVLENAVALVVGGACLGRAAAVAHGTRLLGTELRGQVLADGGHEERSPSYHRAVLERLRDAQAVLSRAGHPGLAELDHACELMTGWLRRIAGPNGCLPLLNDSWAGPPVPAGGGAVDVLPDSGYIVLRHGQDQAVLDVGPLCPPHLPPHAHADALSFVLWANGSPLVVDPGSGGYDEPARTWSRATSTHSTVSVDDEDQCVFLGAFRAARLPRVWHRAPEAREDAVIIAAGHDGYSRLADPVTHRRWFCWMPGDGLVVVDQLHSQEEHEFRSTLRLAPGIDIARAVLRPSSFGDGPPASASLDRVAPFLGRFESAPVLTRRWRARGTTTSGWALLRSEAGIDINDRRCIILRAGRPPIEIDLLG